VLVRVKHALKVIQIPVRLHIVSLKIILGSLTLLTIVLVRVKHALKVIQIPLRLHIVSLKIILGSLTLHSIAKGHIQNEKSSSIGASTIECLW
jgi:type III secretory pathway component EscR